MRDRCALPKALALAIWTMAQGVAASQVCYEMTSFWLFTSLLGILLFVTGLAAGVVMVRLVLRYKQQKSRVHPTEPTVVRALAIRIRFPLESIPAAQRRIPRYWDGSTETLVTLGPVELELLQQLVDGTFKSMATRDRAGSLPAKLRVVHAHRVQNQELWNHYVRDRYAIKQKRSHRCTNLEKIGGEAISQVFVDGLELMEGLDAEVNEVSAWHGTSPHRAFAIAWNGFQIQGMSKGRMYGAGSYFSECSSKSDEYSQDDGDGIHQGLHCLLLCRVVMGEALHMTTGGEEVHGVIQAALDSGMYDSVLGDRQASVGTYREFVVYEDFMALPQYIVIYTRQFCF